MIGAALAISVGSGGLMTASAETSDSSTSFVPISPCRLVDTRSALALGANQSLTFDAHGTQGDCVLPTSARALVVNLTAVEGSARSFLTLYPGHATVRPIVASVNWEAGAYAVGNQVTVALSADGRFTAYNYAGNVDVVLDVAGYYVSSPAGVSAPGQTGAIGQTGAQGLTGVDGVDGVDSVVAGPRGEIGLTGSSGSGVAALFYAMMPNDNPATVAATVAVAFPTAGPNTAPLGILASGPDNFTLTAIGIYRVSVQLSVTEAAQMVLTVNGVELPYTTVGRATGTGQLTMVVLITTTTPSSILRVTNPAGAGGVLTLTPRAGGTDPVSATVLIELVK